MNLKGSIESTATVPATVPAYTGEQLHLGPLGLRFLIDGPSTGASLTMFELTVPPHAKVPAFHSHDAFDETIYGLDGVLTSTRGVQTLLVGAGDSVFIPRGVVHGFSNPLPQTARVLIVITPPLLGIAFFRELAAVVEANPLAPPDRQSINAVMQRHGLTIAG